MSAMPLSRWQLAASSALSPFALVVVSPMLPELRRLYDATEADVQFVISSYLFGLCIAQLVLGALSDRFGRRIVMLASLFVYIVMTVVCAMAPTLELLIAARFVQACGAAGTAAICRASVHDVAHGDHAAYYMSYIAAAHSIAHTLAPVVGGYAGDVVGVSGVFLGLAVVGVGMWAWSWRAMPETRAHAPGAKQLGLAHLLMVNAMLLRSPVFMCYAMIYGLTGAPFFAFLAAAPAYFADTFNISGGAFGAYWSFMSVAFLTGAMTSARLVRRWGSRRLIAWMVAASGLIGLAWPLAVFVLGATPFLLIAPLVLLSLGLGLITPLTLSGAIAAHPQHAGAASGLCGALTMAASAVLTIAAGATYDGTGLGLTWPMTASMVGMVAFYLGLRFAEGRRVSQGVETG
ncbi:MAG: MFS transporter [Rhodospirillaceae bacterium]|nr:MFS transporter [Rhodospirillaceae bacterium]